MLDDPEVAEELAARAERDGPPTPPALADFNPEVAMLTIVADRLGDVLSQLVANAGHKPPKVAPLPRPRTGVDRARARMEKQQHESLVAEAYAAMDRWRKPDE